MMSDDYLARLASFVLVIAVVFVALIAMLLANAPPARGHHTPENSWLLSWIPAYCCVTNDCCWEIAGRELESLPDDKWKVRATGQVKERTNWSPDGKYYRCACDYDSAEGKWIRHDGANTRCVFVPMQAY